MLTRPSVRLHRLRNDAVVAAGGRGETARARSRRRAGECDDVAARLRGRKRWLAAIAIMLAVGVLWAPIYGPEAALLCELFATRVRYTGISIVYQVGAIIFLAPLPILATLPVAWND